MGASVHGKDMLFSYAPTFLRTYAPTHLRTYAPTYAPILCAAPAHSRRNGTQRFELVIGGVGDVRGKASITRARCAALATSIQR